MKSLCLTAALAASVLCAASASAADEPAKVKIDSGLLVGTAKGPVVSFKGIPFAAAPVGSLRWAPPQEPARWTGARAADAFGAICPQPMKVDGTPNEGGAQGVANEDCLYLNVWAPAGASKAPVMLWIHGGGNTTGAGSIGAYDGSAFARDGIILVTINYRLGALGFFAHPALTRAAAPDAPLISYAILDQIAALRWVRRNIAAFGGDAANVTVFGESAGGGDTLVLLSTPKAKGLFAKAIVESGGGWSPAVTLAKREAQGEALARSLGAPVNPTLGQLRALPAAALVATPSGDSGVGIDGRLLTESPAQAFARGHALKVPLIIGSNSYEASLLKTFKAPPAAILATASDSVKAAYADLPGDADRADAIFTDGVMGAPAHWIAGKASGGPSFLYHFAYVLEAQRGFLKGAPHAFEIPYVFDSWDHLGALSLGFKPNTHDLAVTALVHSCWVAFAKTGRPTCPGGAAWPAYGPAADTLIDFDGGPTLKSHFRKTQYDAQEAAKLPTLGLGAE